jgi:hypothetical protein
VRPVGCPSKTDFKSRNRHEISLCMVQQKDRRPRVAPESRYLQEVLCPVHADTVRFYANAAGCTGRILSFAGEESIASRQNVGLGAPRAAIPRLIAKLHRFLRYFPGSRKGRGGKNANDVVAGGIELSTTISGPASAERLLQHRRAVNFSRNPHMEFDSQTPGLDPGSASVRVQSAFICGRAVLASRFVGSLRSPNCTTARRRAALL